LRGAIIVLMLTVQIFGLKNSQATRAAERFFKERRVNIQFVDLKQRPMAPAEILRFSDRFGLGELIDREGRAWTSAGLGYFKLSDADLLAKIEKDPALLKLPLVRSGNKLAIGHAEPAWKDLVTANG
jgi:arsenate reductase-like glutaredoxin family protein